MQSTMALRHTTEAPKSHIGLSRGAAWHTVSIRRNTIAKRPDFANVAGPFAGNPLSTHKRTFFPIWGDAIHRSWRLPSCGFLARAPVPAPDWQSRAITHAPLPASYLPEPSFASW